MTTNTESLVEPLFELDEKIRVGFLPDVQDLRTALVDTEARVHDGEAPTIGQPEVRRSVEALVGRIVDETIAHPENRAPWSGEGAFAQRTGERILAGLGTPGPEIERQKAWWQLLTGYGRDKRPFANTGAFMSGSRREIAGARAIHAGVTLLIDDRVDLALPYFEYALHLAAEFVPATTDLELVAWIADMEPHNPDDRAQMRRQLVVGAMGRFTEQRTRAHYSAAAQMVAKQREIHLDGLTSDELTRAEATLYVYQRDGVARLINPIAPER